MSTFIVVVIHPIVNSCNKFGSRGIGVAVVAFVFERRPQRFGAGVVPALTGSPHRAAQPVPGARGSHVGGGGLAAPVRMQDRAATPATADEHRPIHSMQSGPSWCGYAHEPPQPPAGEHRSPCARPQSDTPARTTSEGVT